MLAQDAVPELALRILELADRLVEFVVSLDQCTRPSRSVAQSDQVAAQKYAMIDRIESYRRQYHREIQQLADSMDLQDRQLWLQEVQIRSLLNRTDSARTRQDYEDRLDQILYERTQIEDVFLHGVRHCPED